MRRFSVFAVAVVLAIVSVAPAEAGCGLFARAKARRAARVAGSSCVTGQVATFQSYTVQNYQYTAAPAPVPVYSVPVQACPNGQCPAVPSKVIPTSAVSPSDPYNFGSWINAQRARYGLPAVVCDPTLTAWAAQNNLYQSSRGIGHYVMGIARRQNSAMGAYSSIGVMWMNSPAHRAAILDPSVTTFGLANSGPWWTLDLR